MVTKMDSTLTTPPPILSQKSHTAYNQPITIAEVCEAIKRARNFAAGPDKIHPMMLKKFPKKAISAITYLLNRI